MNQQKVMLASELFAYSQGTSCSGSYECHWCGGPCDNKRLHDDPPPTPFIRTTITSKKTSSPYECLACWLYRRKRVTIKWLSGMIEDRKTFCNYSWLITREDFRVIHHKEDKEALYKFLLKPTLRFCLSLISEKHTNLLQYAIVNTNKEILADTELAFTLNSVPYSYSIYELEEGLRHGSEGRLPGVRTLIELFGSYTLLPKEEPKKQERVGRPNRDPNPPEIPSHKRKVAGR